MVSLVFEVVDARKRFNTVQALDGVSFFLRRGEWIALLGPNGSGKTTLVRSVAGRILLDSGTITINNCVLDQSSIARNVRRKLGIVTQEIALYPSLTASENLEIWGSLYAVSGEELAKKVQWSLEWTGLDSRKSECIENYSSGMKRRLNIACSVLHDPEILLLDEPTVGVDPQSRQRIWEMLKGLHAKGVSLLLTTHQLEEAQQLCERIVIIDHGCVIANGSFEELLQQTIGPERRLTLHLDQAVPDSFRRSGFKIGGESTFHCKLKDVAEELPGLLEEISRAGAKVRELLIESPSLHEVFIHLTGRELRE